MLLATSAGGLVGPFVGHVLGIDTAIADPDTAHDVELVIAISEATPITDRRRGDQ